MIDDPATDKNARLSDGTPIFHVMCIYAPAGVVKHMMQHPETEVAAVGTDDNALTATVRHIGERRARDKAYGQMHDDTAAVLASLISDARIDLDHQATDIDGDSKVSVLHMGCYADTDAYFVLGLLQERQRVLALPGREKIMTALYGATEEVTVCDTSINITPVSRLELSDRLPAAVEQITTNVFSTAVGYKSFSSQKFDHEAFKPEQVRCGEIHSA